MNLIVVAQEVTRAHERGEPPRQRVFRFDSSVVGLRWSRVVVFTTQDQGHGCGSPERVTEWFSRSFVARLAPEGTIVPMDPHAEAFVATLNLGPCRGHARARQ